MVRIIRTEQRSAPIGVGGASVVTVSHTRSMAVRLGWVAAVWQRTAPVRAELIGAAGRIIEMPIPDAVWTLRMALAGWTLWRWLRRR
ncbi:MAG: hypothetical protein ACE5E8_00835 [Acidimicrobiia bacterium]